MYTLTEIREELKIKERSVNDLIRYIKTRTDDNPNYSLLLGAGCSVRYKLKLHKTSSPRINIESLYKSNKFIAILCLYRTRKGAYITTVSNQTHNYNQSSYAVFHFDATLLQHDSFLKFH